jgi:hypothetical protein
MRKKGEMRKLREREERGGDTITIGARDERGLDVAPLLVGVKDERDQKERKERQLCCERGDTSPSLAIAKA